MPFRRFAISAREFRIMASKRALISVLATVCIILGIYLGFFNHPPANETLAINLAHQDHKFVPFKHLHSRLYTSDEKTSVLRALNVSDNMGVQHQELRTAKLANSNNTALKNLGANIRTNSKQNEDKSESLHQEDVPGEDPFKNIADDENQNFADEDENQNLADKDENQNHENDSGNNAGEEKTTEDKRIAEETAEAEHMERNAGKSKEYGPHHIRIFDWDGWVKRNNHIDIGTIWAYCGESTFFAVKYEPL